jgi:hypothetical protein
MPRGGETVWVGRDASVQFIAVPAFAFRVIHVHDWPTYDGWVWLDGYQLDTRGDAVERRTIWVQPAGLRPVPAPDVPAPGETHKPRNTAPAPVPRQRTAPATTSLGRTHA